MSDTALFNRLLREYEDVGIGTLILDRVEAIVRTTTSRYDPRIYGGSARWEDCFDDVVQSFVVEVLIRERQLDYVFAHVADMKGFNRLLGRQLSRYLARSRRRTVVDNLLDRARRIASKEPFKVRASGSSWRYTLSAKTPDASSLGDHQLRESAVDVSLIPVSGGAGSERNPVIYSTETLTRILHHLADSHDSWLSQKDLDWIFNSVLTPWVPTFLSTDTSPIESESPPALSHAEQIEARQTAARLVEQCNAMEKNVLRRKLADVADSDVAREFGISRPTVAKHKKTVFEAIRLELESASQTMQVAVLSELAVLLL